MASLNYDKAPNNLGPTLQRYIEDKIPMGGFMMAVASNDLREAFGRADIYNRDCLLEIVSWFYNEAPSSCWGSYEAVRQWLAQPEETNESGNELVDDGAQFGMGA